MNQVSLARIAMGFFASIVLIFLLVPHMIFGQDRPARDGRIANQYIVVLKGSLGDIDASERDIISRVRGQKINSYRSVFSGFAAQFSDADLATVANDPRVAFVSEDHEISIADATPARGTLLDRIAEGFADRQIVSSSAARRVSTEAKSVSTQAQSLPTGIDRINAEGKTNTGAGVDVAVIDTGILSSHPDLSGKVVGGTNCTRASGGYTDQNGHGTHVSGTIAALNNTLGVVGVAPGVRLWSVRVLDRNGSGTWSSVICGLDFVTSLAPANGGPIKVANMSLGGTGTSDNNCGNTNNDALHQAICRARDAGVAIVVAAGNSSVDASTFVPAAYNDAVITVSALADSDGAPGGTGAATYYGADDTFASFSNYGKAVDIGAPGVNIYSTWLANGYATLSGTSMASPHVAGAAALYIAVHPGALWSGVRDALVAAGEAQGAGHSDPGGKHPEPVLRADTL